MFAVPFRALTAEWGSTKFRLTDLKETSQDSTGSSVFLRGEPKSNLPI
jgi:hypothetical protein